MTEYINIKEVRQHFGKVRAGLNNGIHYIVIYRSQPIAELRPLKKTNESKNHLADFFASPPEKMKFRSEINAVNLVRQERD